MKNDPSEWMIFEDTHETIIEESVFEVVQRIRDGRRRLTPMGEMPLLSGMMFCADCGNKLYQVRGRGWEHEKEYFVCATYRKIKGGCSSHQIRNVVVEELLLDGIRRVTAFARDCEDEFVEMVTKKTRTELDKSMRRQSNVNWSRHRLVSANWTKLSKGFMKIISRVRYPMSVLQR